MITTTYSFKLYGMSAVPAQIETSVVPGIGIHLVGLADAAVKESLLRTVTAIQSLGYHIPGKKIVINLAPADLHKSGSVYDAAIALSLIAASEQDEQRLASLADWMVVGEVGLDGTIRPVFGAIQAVEAAKEKGLKGCIIPRINAAEVTAAIDDNFPVYAATSLSEMMDIIASPETHPTIFEEKRNNTEPSSNEEDNRMWDYLSGNESAKRAIEIAAAGGFNMVLIGPPGSGKSATAKCLNLLLPPMTKEEALVTAKIYSAACGGYPMQTATAYANKRPFRSPHYSTSLSGLLGGGTGDNIRPGEVSLASNGVLYLDEAEYLPMSACEALRAPFEDRKVVISRLKTKVEYPANGLTVLAMNPCPCGYYGEGDRCTCTPGQIAAYRAHYPTVLLDHCAIQVWMHQINPTGFVLNPYYKPEPLTAVQDRVKKAIKRQQERFACKTYSRNNDIPRNDMNEFCRLSGESGKLLETVINKLGLSARAYTRILKIARTIADLSDSDDIRPEHVAEAASYRFLDRLNQHDSDNGSADKASRPCTA